MNKFDILNELSSIKNLINVLVSAVNEEVCNFQDISGVLFFYLLPSIEKIENELKEN